MHHGSLFRSPVSPVVEAPRQRIVLGTHWALNLGIPLLVLLFVFNLVATLAK